MAERDLPRLSADVHAWVIVVIAGLASNPRPSGCRKLVGGQYDWRVRVGDYRVIYEITDTIRIVRVNRVRHRREVYRSMGVNDGFARLARADSSSSNSK